MTYNCALIEGVFHDVPIGMGPVIIDPVKLDNLVCSERETLKTSGSLISRRQGFVSSV